MNGGSVERLRAVRDTQEACTLLECARPKPCNLEQVAARRERTAGVAMRHDRFGKRRSQPRNARQQQCRRRVEVDADGIDRILHHRFKRAAEPVLVDIVLVLADADRFRLDLDQLGQWILQASRDRHRAAQRDIEARELCRCRGRSGIDRSTRFADDHLERLRPGTCRLLGLAAAGAVADRDQFHFVLADEGSKFRLRAAHIVPRRKWINRRRRHQLAGAVDDRHLDAGADTRVETHRRPRAGGSCQQQVLQIAGENMDRLFLGPLAQVAHQVERQMQRQLDPPGPACHLHQPAIARQAGADHIGVGDHAFDRLHWRLIVGIDLDVERQHLLVAAAQHGQSAVAGHASPALDMIEIVGEFRACLLLAVDDPGAQEGALLHIGAQLAHQVGVLGKLLRQDVARAF